MRPEHSSIDWPEIARAVGAFNKEDGECGSREMARAALELILGENTLCNAVDHYISGQPGAELVRHVLWLLHPLSAMKRCYEIYKSDRLAEDRIAAIELLRVVADSRALQWIPEFLNDTEPDIQNWGVGVLDQLLWGGGVDEEDCGQFLEMARNHASGYVREQAAFIDGYLRSRKGRG